MWVSHPDSGNELFNLNVFERIFVDQDSIVLQDVEGGHVLLTFESEAAAQRAFIAIYSSLKEDVKLLKL